MNTAEKEEGEPGVIIVQTPLAARSSNRSPTRFGRGAWMRIVIAGGTGFLGSPLAETYAEEGHDVRVLTRGLPSGESRHDPGTGVPGVNRVGWRPDGQSGPWAAVIDGADAVVNLAGEGIADARWTP